MIRVRRAYDECTICALASELNGEKESAKEEVRDGSMWDDRNEIKRMKNVFICSFVCSSHTTAATAAADVASLKT